MTGAVASGNGLPDRDAELAAAIQALLEPGETLRLHGSVHIAHGEIGPATEWEDFDELSAAGNRFWSFATRTWPRKIVFFTLLSPLLLIALVESIGDGISGWLDRRIGGVTCAGPRGSTARKMQWALSPLGAQGNRLAVTDRRLLVVREHISFRNRPPQVELKWSAPVEEIASAKPHPRGLLRRRLQVSFIDGSLAILACPLPDGPRPARAAEALTQRDARPSDRPRGKRC